MGSLTDGNACYGGTSESFGITEDLIGGGLGGTYLSPGQCGGGKKRKQMRTKKKRGSSKRKNRRVSTMRKKRGSSKRKNRGSFKGRKHSKREVVQSIMKGLGEKRKSRKKSIKGGGKWGKWRERKRQGRLEKRQRKENTARFRRPADVPVQAHNYSLERKSLLPRIFKKKKDKGQTTRNWGAPIFNPEEF